MRIAFPTNNQKTIASHIGLAKGFLIIDTNTNEKFYIENPVIKRVQEEHMDLKNTEEGQRGLGTGRVIPPLLKEAGVNILVSRDFGEGMIKNLEFEGIRAFETDKKDIEEILNQIKENNMKEITKFDERDYERNFDNREYAKGFGYGRRLGYGKGSRRGMGYGFRRGFGYGRGFDRGCKRGFGKRWED